MVACQSKGRARKKHLQGVRAQSSRPNLTGNEVTGVHFVTEDGAPRQGFVPAAFSQTHDRQHPTCFLNQMLKENILKQRALWGETWSQSPSAPGEAMWHLRQQTPSEHPHSHQCHPAPKSPRGVLQDSRAKPREMLTLGFVLLNLITADTYV